jgi:hypothetical protein
MFYFMPFDPKRKDGLFIKTNGKSTQGVFNNYAKGKSDQGEADYSVVDQECSTKGEHVMFLGDWMD